MKKSEDQIVQKFPYRCPYCEEVVSYEEMDLKPGENEIVCPTCKRNYIKIVEPSSTEGHLRRHRK